MSTTHRGGCRCGAIRYEIAAEPMFGGQCQCLDCQHETGGGHTSFVAFPAEAVKLTGTPRLYEVQADSGHTVRRGFCPTSAGSLDDPSIFKPQFVCYTSRGHAWDFVDPALPSFPKMPPMPAGEQPTG
jgi:hypothetical protein